MNRKKVYIINPTYNEAQNIRTLIENIHHTLDDIKIYERFDIVNLIVDDNSPDGTGNIVKEFEKKYNSQTYKVKLFCRNIKNGLAAAYIAGFKYAIDNGADFVIQMDADLSHDPIYLINFLECVDDFDCVLSSRYIKGGDVKNWSWHRKLLSRFASFYARNILNFPIHDCTGGYNMFSKKALKYLLNIGIDAKGYGFLVEMKYKLYRAKFKFCEIPIIFVDRKYGKSKMDLSIGKEAAIMILKLRFQ